MFVTTNFGLNIWQHCAEAKKPKKKKKKIWSMVSARGKQTNIVPATPATSMVPATPAISMVPAERNVKMKCAVPHCGTFSYHPSLPGHLNKPFFKLPHEEPRRQMWLEILKIPYTAKEVRICNEHFDGSAFTNSYHNRLLKFAKPLPFGAALTEVAQNVEVKNKQIEVEAENKQMEVEAENKQLEVVYYISDSDDEKPNNVLEGPSKVQEVIKTVLSRDKGKPSILEEALKSAIITNKQDTAVSKKQDTQKNAFVEVFMGNELLRQKIDETKNKIAIKKSKLEEFQLPSGRKVIFCSISGDNA